MDFGKLVLKKADEISPEFDGEVIGCYQTGSRVYQCFTEDSDHDFVVVLGTKINVDEIVDDEKTKISLHFIDEVSFSKKIQEYDAVYLQILFLQKNFVLRENQQMMKIKKQWKLYSSSLESSICNVVDFTLTKSQRYYETSKYVSLKNIIHSIRYLQFGIQIAQYRRIIDYTSANKYFNEIFKLDYKKWEEYYSHYEKVLEGLKNDLKKIIKESREFVLKELKGKFSIEDFFKLYTLQDLEFYFSIQVKKDKYFYVLEPINKYDPFIQELDYPFIISKDLNKHIIKGIKHLRFDDEIRDDMKYYKFKYLKMKIPVSEGGYYIYKFSNQEFSYDYKGYNDCELHPNQFQLLDSEGDIIYSYSKYNTNFESDFKRVEPKDLFSENPSESLQLIGVEENGDIYIIQHPIDTLKEKVKNNEISLKEAAIIGILKYRLSSFGNDIKDGFATLERMKKNLKKLNDTVKNEYEYLKSNFEKEFEKICKESPIGDLMLALDQVKYDEILKEMDVKNIEKLFEYKQKKRYLKLSEEEIETWKSIQIGEILSIEILSIIVEYLDINTIRILSYSLKLFNWISKDSRLLKKIPYYYKGYYEINVEKLMCFHDTEEFKSLSRLLPFQDLKSDLNLYEHLYLFKERELNEFEKDCFCVIKNTPFKVVPYNQFLKNMDILYGFNEWKNDIDWDFFAIHGVSLVRALTFNPKEETKNNEAKISLLYTGVQSKNHFYKFISRAKSLLLKGTFSEYYNDTSLSFEIDLSNKKSVHFNLLRFYENSNDFDIKQVYFNGKEIYCSLPFIQSLNTGTFMNYPDNSKSGTEDQDIQDLKDIGFIQIYDFIDDTQVKKGERMKYINSVKKVMVNHFLKFYKFNRMVE